MKLLYVDPSLKCHRGHHANVAAALTDSFRSLGSHVTLAVSQSKEPGLEGEKVFACDVYRHMKRDPHRTADQLRMRAATANVCAEMLPILTRLRPSVVYAHSVNAIVVEGLVQAINALYEPSCRPRLIAELPFPCEPKPHYFYGEQLKRMFSRLKQGSLPVDDVVTPVTVNVETSAMLSKAIDFPVGVMPSPYRTMRKRLGTGDDSGQPIVFGSVGHQSLSKGFRLLPEIIRISGLVKPTAHWIVQHQPESESEIVQQLRNLQSQGFSVELIDQDLTRGAYEALLQRMDVLLLPYQPERYQSAISGVCYEALSQGSLLVVPEATTLGRTTRQFQPSSIQFQNWNPDDIATTVRAVTCDYLRLSKEAREGADRYLAENGPDAYANAVLDRAFRVEPRLSGGGLRRTGQRLYWSTRRLVG